MSELGFLAKWQNAKCKCSKIHKMSVFKSKGSFAVITADKIYQLTPGWILSL